MTNELAKVIVKVGKRSSIKFSNCKLYRAIMPSELKEIHKAHKDCNMLVIESISEDEQTEIRDFAKQFKEESADNSVFFYIPNASDEITSGIADELNYEIYLTLDSLYEAIYKKYGINLSVYIDDKKKYNSIEDISGMDTIPSFEQTLISNFDDELKEAEKEQKAVQQLQQEVKQEVVEQTQQSQQQSEAVQSVESSKIVNKAASVEADTHTETSSKTDLEAIQDLKIKLNDLKYDYKQALDSLREATDYSTKLEETIKVIREEKDDIIDRFKKLMEDNEVIEEPISLSEYNKLNEQIKDHDKLVKELEATVDKLKKSIEDHKVKITEQAKTLAEKNKTLTEKNEELIKKNALLDEQNITIEQLNYKIDSGELEQAIIDEYEPKLKAFEASLSEATGKLTKEITYRMYITATVKRLISSLVAVTNRVKSLEVELVSTNEIINDYKVKYDDKVKEYEDSLNDNTAHLSEIKILKNQIETANKRAQLADNYANSENKKLTAKISELETNLKIVKDQLEYKETQYKDLLDKSKDNSLTSKELTESNNTLDMINKTLKEKLGATTKELDSYKKEAERTINSYKDRIKKLTEALQSSNPNMENIAGTAGIIGNAISLKVAPIKYTGTAKIIPVFGSGSHGITTTAMSIAGKLSASNKVLYLDFDIVSPSADAWFAKVPICKNLPGIPNNDMRMSALGIFLEIGIEAFEKYAVNIVIQCERTKGGGIDYMSGLYYRADAGKLATANYTELLNFLGNMYQYIIVDMGRLGNSEVNDNVIKAFSDIAYRCITVTTSDKFEARNFSIKLKNNGIDLSKIAWLVNMCETTNIDEKTRQSISPCAFGIMLKDMSLSGNREKFTRYKLNKDRLEFFMNTVLFKQ